MIEVRAEPLTSPEITPEEDLEIYEILDAIEPPREAQRAIARYTVQKALRLDFIPTQHIYCATDSDRGWFSRIQKVRHSKYKSMDGLVEGDVENEVTTLDLWEVIYE